MLVVLSSYKDGATSFSGITASHTTRNSQARGYSMSTSMLFCCTATTIILVYKATRMLKSSSPTSIVAPCDGVAHANRRSRAAVEASFIIMVLSWERTKSCFSSSNSSRTAVVVVLVVVAAAAARSSTIASVEGQRAWK